jgi:hypothetical protein
VMPIFSAIYDATCDCVIIRLLSVPGFRVAKSLNEWRANFKYAHPKKCYFF